ncbi:Uncharacterised protein [Providencia rustigianii]|nr:Uncharacterised protein [Providencia rustigianii]
MLYSRDFYKVILQYSQHVTPLLFSHGRILMMKVHKEGG